MAMVGVDDPDARDILAGLLCRLPDPCVGSDEDRGDQSCFGRFDGGEECRRAARMGNGGALRLAFREVDQPAIAVMIAQLDFG